jgi:spoIIIJ-associated protein
MKEFKRKGNSVQEILKQFSEEHQINQNQIKYEVIQESSPGFLGFLGKKKVILKIQISDVSAVLKEFTVNLMSKMSVEFDSVMIKKEGDSYQVSVIGSKEPGFIIGKEGRMLENLQYLLNRVFEKEAGLDKIYLDVDGYKERQEEKLIRRIKPIIERAREKQQSVTLDPMNPAERRIIHKYVENDTQLRTLTVGEGKMKRIVIFPSKGNNTTRSQQTRPNRNPHQRNNTSRFPNRRKRSDEPQSD